MHLRTSQERSELSFAMCDKDSIVREKKSFPSKSFPSDRVRNKMPSSADLNECFRRTEKKMLKSVGASMVSPVLRQSNKLIVEH